MAFNGTDSVFFAHFTTALASGMRKGGSISAAAFAPTMSVVTLLSPFSDELIMCVSRPMASGGDGYTTGGLRT